MVAVCQLLAQIIQSHRIQQHSYCHRLVAVVWGCSTCGYMAYKVSRTITYNTHLVWFLNQGTAHGYFKLAGQLKKSLLPLCATHTKKFLRFASLSELALPASRLIKYPMRQDPLLTVFMALLALSLPLLVWFCWEILHQLLTTLGFVLWSTHYWLSAPWY